MPLMLVRAAWGGNLPGGGVSTFLIQHTTPEAVPAITQAFFTALAPLIPTGVTIGVEGSGYTLDPSTGQATGTFTSSDPTPATGAGGTNWLASGGANITWQTATFRNGRRVRGRTFLVPLAAVCFVTDGTLASAQRTSIVNIAQDFLDGLDESGGYLVIGSRTPTFQTARALSASVPDQATVLRSRRS